jgi:hypothetical protein
MIPVRPATPSAVEFDQQAQRSMAGHWQLHTRAAALSEEKAFDDYLTSMLKKTLSALL